MTRFRDVQHAIIMATVWIDDDETKSDYNQEENLDYVRVVKPSDKTPNTNDDVTTKTITVHMKHNTWQVSVHVVFLLGLFSLASSSSLIAHLIVAQVVRVSHVIHACSERHSSTLSSPIHPTSSSSHSPSISCSPCCSSSTSLRISCNTACSANRRWSLLTSPASPQVMSPKTTTYVESPHRVLDPATVPWATVPRGCGLRWHRARGDAS